MQSDQKSFYISKWSLSAVIFQACTLTLNFSQWTNHDIPGNVVYLFWKTAWLFHSVLLQRREYLSEARYVFCIAFLKAARQYFNILLPGRLRYLAMFVKKVPVRPVRFLKVVWVNVSVKYVIIVKNVLKKWLLRVRAPALRLLKARLTAMKNNLLLLT